MFFAYSVSAQIKKVIGLALINKNRSDIAVLIVNVKKTAVVDQSFKTVDIVKVFFVFFKAPARLFPVKKRTFPANQKNHFHPSVFVLTLTRFSSSRLIPNS